MDSEGARWHGVAPGGAEWRGLVLGGAKRNWVVRSGAGLPGGAGWHWVAPGGAGWCRGRHVSWLWSVVVRNGQKWSVVVRNSHHYGSFCHKKSKKSIF